MDFSTFTAQQEQSVRHLDGPLFIAAGAGSGKTFTLQQRIAYALLPESGPALSSVDEVLAITFMEKAAAEIKARVRSALRAEGMAQEALKVDSAWISTIHGMCARILREHALEAGIDPSFTVLSEFDAKLLRRVSIEEVLDEARNDDGFVALFAEYGVVSAGLNGVSVFGMLDALMAKAASFSAGLDAVDFGAPAPRAGLIARHVLSAYEAAFEHGTVTAATRKKPSATLEKTLAACADACGKLEDFLRSGGDYAELAQLLGALQPLTKASLGRNDEAGSELSLDVARTLDWAYVNVNAALARPYAEDLLALARRVEEAYQRNLDERAVLDNNGLLRRTLNLLGERGDIAASYQRRFKLVMVDEFQDTNQMQVDLIKLVAGDARLCTVGDAQQSIYRFNGADVSVFERQRACVKDASDELSALEARLDSNFRSHSDILAFVRCVCAQNRVFGEGFLDLEPERKPQEGRYFGEGPRIEVQLVSYKGSKTDAGAVEAEAAGIARRFAALRDAGHKPGDMVVLLGKMTAADTYAAALRAQGFECVFGGGRSFFQLEEVQVVRCALAALANPKDTRALFSLLSSPMMRLSADDFLMLSCSFDDEGQPLRRGIDEGLLAMSLGDEEPPTPALAFAAELMGRARQRIRGQRPSQVLMGLLVDSGWFSRLEGQGTEGVAVAANVLKAVRMVENLEGNRGYGLARVARDFADMARQDSSGPASLSVSGQNAVRIMTVHKSKGLEFPIVAAASYEPWEGSSGCFDMTANAGKVHVSLSLKHNKVKPAKALAARYDACCADDDFADARGCAPSSAEDAAQFACFVRAFDWAEEVCEAQRKFYVACTRASEYLLVSGLVPHKDDAESALSAYASVPVLDDVRAALMGEGRDFPAQSDYLPYGGSAPLLFERVFVSAVRSIDELVGDEGTAGVEPGCADNDAAAGNEPGRASDEVSSGESRHHMEVPIFAPDFDVACEVVTGRHDVFSYSGIAPREDHMPILEDVGLSLETLDADAPAATDVSGIADAPAATDLGSAFHRMGQLAVERLTLCGFLALPPASSVDAIARRYGITGESRVRLDDALDRWFSSDVARRAESFARVRAEVPFMVRAFDLPNGAPVYLEGEIDLLAESADGANAFVVDYKTGGSPSETFDRLREKHRLQAMCYAYALLVSRSYDSVDFAFVRVEQVDPDSPNQPQVVPYSFSRNDVAALKDAIVKAYELASA